MGNGVNNSINGSRIRCTEDLIALMVTMIEEYAYCMQAKGNLRLGDK